MKYIIRLVSQTPMQVDIPKGGFIRMGSEIGRVMDNTPHDTIRVYDGVDPLTPIMVFNNVSYFKKM